MTFWRITCTFAQEVLFNQAFPSVSIGKHTLLNAYRVAGFLHPTPARLSLQKNRPNPCKERTWRACVLFCHPVFPVFIGICIAFIVRGEKNTDSISQNWNCHNLSFVFEGSKLRNMEGWDYMYTTTPPRQTRNGIHHPCHHFDSQRIANFWRFGYA